MNRLRLNLRAVPWLLCAAVLAVLSPARAETWTNQAGRVVEGRLGAFDGLTVTLIRTNGTELKLPLSALRLADQRRVRLLTARPVVPDFVLSAFRDASTVWDQYRRLPADRQTDEARRKAAQMACLVFDGRLKDRSALLADKDVQAEVKRLRAALASPAK